VAVGGGGVSEVVDVDRFASYFLTVSIEWASAAEESDVIADSLGNGHALPVTSWRRLKTRPSIVVRSAVYFPLTHL